MKTAIFLGCFLVAMVAAAPEDMSLRELEEDIEEAFRLGGDLHLDRKSTFTGLSSAQKQDILDRHNEVRAKVSPTASNMLQMSWSDELARTAQNYANRCIWQHNGERSSGSSLGYVGENLYVTSGSYNAQRVISSWAGEVRLYSYSSTSCTGVCGHYTQAVWATSEYLGCGARQCRTVQGLGWRDATVVVCNYGRGGNYRGQKPYQQGRPCSECPSGKVCHNGLCANPGSSGKTGNGNTSTGSGSTKC